MHTRVIFILKRKEGEIGKQRERQRHYYIIIIELLNGQPLTAKEEEEVHFGCFVSFFQTKDVSIDKEYT
jgi:hypothetical protein